MLWMPATVGSNETTEPVFTDTAPASGELLFSSDFEGGNLAAVTRTKSFEYELQLCHDSNNPKYRLWFHFAVRNCCPSQQALFTITNFSKGRSLYRHGMTPVIRSTSRPAWARLPAQNVFYYRCADLAGSYVLTFPVTFDRPGDIYELAYSYPFTYTLLQHELFHLDALHLPYLRHTVLARSTHCRRIDLLTIAEPLLPCPIEAQQPRPTGHSCTGPDPLCSLLPDAGAMIDRQLGMGGRATEGQVLGPGVPTVHDWLQPVVLVTGRAHPGESPSSLVVQGLINYLLSSVSDACTLRHTLTWLVVPMLNPDGVAAGNYRTDAGGMDLNRLWPWAHAASTPALAGVLHTLEAYQHSPRHQVGLYIDVHAHTTSRSSCMYTTAPELVLAARAAEDEIAPSSPRGSQTVTDGAVEDEQTEGEKSFGLYKQAEVAAMADRIMQLPRLLSASMPGFSLAACTLDADSGAKATCARRVVGALWPHTLCYTLEVSCFHSSPGEVTVITEPGALGQCTAHNNTAEGYLEMGRQLATAIGQLHGIRPTAPASLKKGPC